MICDGFLDPESRKDLIELARDGSVAHGLGRRANAVLLLDDGMTCEATARVLFVDDDTVRTWYQDYQENGIEGLANFGRGGDWAREGGGACRLTAEQQDTLKAWIAAPAAQHFVGLLAGLQPASREDGVQVPHAVRRREQGHDTDPEYQFVVREPLLAATQLLYTAPSPGRLVFRFTAFLAEPSPHHAQPDYQTHRQKPTGIDDRASQCALADAVVPRPQRT
jgi:hypothetical protein